LGRPQASFAKRQREQAKRERQQLKAERKAERPSGGAEIDDQVIRETPLEDEAVPGKAQADTP
jgi:hypothetical protein